MPTANRLLRNSLGAAANVDELAAHWATSILPDYIVCNLHGSPLALRFASDYAQQEGATILDMGSFSLLTPEQLRQSAAELPRLRPARTCHRRNRRNT